MSTHTRFARWLYRGGRPNRLGKFINNAWAAIAAWGAAPNYMARLVVRGRKSGRAISLPVVIAVIDSERYLVSMLGEQVDWVRNVRAAGGAAALEHGRREEITLEDVPRNQRAAVLKAYLQAAPGARPHIALDKDAPLSEFEKLAPLLPTFRIRTRT